MRDPAPPRRNPFFEHGSEGAIDDPGMGWRDPPEPDATERSSRPDVDQPADAGSGFATLLALVEGLSDAQPEAAERLIAAAHEVVLTVKVLVDATEAVLAEQRRAMAARSRSEAQADGGYPAGEWSDGPAERSDEGGVTDLAVVRRAEVP